MRKKDVDKGQKTHNISIVYRISLSDKENTVIPNGVLT